MNLASLINDAQYTQFVRKTMKHQVRGLRRRGFIAALHRLMQETNPKATFTGVEVGVKFGTFSQQILEMLPQVRQMTLVDPWKEYPQNHPDRDKFSYAGRKQSGWDNMAEMCEKRMQPFGRRARIIRATSMDAAQKLSSQRFFVVYIDAGHSCEDVLADCKAWWPLVEAGGILSGDDYRPKGHKDRTESVSSAVELFAQFHGLEIVPHHRNWFLQKS